MADVQNTGTFNDPVNGLYVPFRGMDRASGAIGTLQVHANVTGDAAGGTATIFFNAQRDMFGFHGLYVPWMVNCDDDQAAGTAVRMSYLAAGNERLFDNMEITERKRETVASRNFTSWSRDELQMLIEPDQAALTVVLSFLWAANVDTKVYHARVFFVVYDLEAMSKRGNFAVGPSFLDI